MSFAHNYDKVQLENLVVLFLHGTVSLVDHLCIDFVFPIPLGIYFLGMESTVSMFFRFMPLYQQTL